MPQDDIKRMFNTKAFLSSLTNHPGVYQMLGSKGEVLYVGKAKNLKKRVSSYFSKNAKDVKTLALVKHIKDIHVTITHSENEALLLESNLIKKYKPHYNVLFRDDKSYPYILITNEHPFPRIDIYRGQRKKDGLYFGPYPNSLAVRETIHLIQKLFGIRTCHDHFFSSRTRPCLHYQIGLCSGSCGKQISPGLYQQDVQRTILFLQGKNQALIEGLQKQMQVASDELNYELATRLRDQMTRLRQIQERQYVSGLEGDVDVIGFAESAGVVCIQLLTIRGGRILGSRAYFPITPAGSTKEEILSAFITQHYHGTDIPKEIIMESALPERDLLENVLSEQANYKVILSHSVRKERKKWLEMAVTNAKQSLASHLLSKTNFKDRLIALQKFLHLKILPKRIECFDISHTMGEETVGSCVVFDSNGPLKSDYRRFNITDITPGDDIAAMEQTVYRRYKKIQLDQNKLPDIVLIDGGTTQLNSAKKVFATLDIHHVLLIGVAKGPARKPGMETLYIGDNLPVSLPFDSSALHLIQQIRDEAHRFAITGHRQRRDKKRHTSSLEKIPGIGAKRRRELLHYFGGIQALTRASLEELMKVPGISKELAQRIFEALHNVTS